MTLPSLQLSCCLLNVISLILVHIILVGNGAMPAKNILATVW